jgi:hypothetical protein
LTARLRSADPNISGSTQTPFGVLTSGSHTLPLCCRQAALACSICRASDCATSTGCPLPVSKRTRGSVVVGGRNVVLVSRLDDLSSSSEPATRRPHTPRSTTRTATMAPSVAPKPRLNPRRMGFSGGCTTRTSRFLRSAPHRKPVTGRSPFQMGEGTRDFDRGPSR